MSTSTSPSAKKKNAKFKKARDHLKKGRMQANHEGKHDGKVKDLSPKSTQRAIGNNLVKSKKSKHSKTERIISRVKTVAKKGKIKESKKTKRQVNYNQTPQTGFGLNPYTTIMKNGIYQPNVQKQTVPTGIDKSINEYKTARFSTINNMIRPTFQKKYIPSAKPSTYRQNALVQQKSASWRNRVPVRPGYQSTPLYSQGSYGGYYDTKTGIPNVSRHVIIQGKSREEAMQKGN